MSTFQRFPLIVVNYKHCENFEEARKPFVEGHKSFLNSQYEKGILMLFGPLDPHDLGGFLVFDNVNKEQLEEILQTDPYVINKIVPNYTINTLNSLMKNIKS